MVSNLADRYREVWARKTIKQVEGEGDSYHKYLARHKDSFFKECAPDSLSDGNRIVILKDLLREKKNGKIT